MGVEQLDVVKRENKNLADEIKDLLDQLGDGGRSIHELDKQRRRLEVEKEELHQAKNSEDKAKKAMVDAARLADELRAEQDHAANQEKAKRTLESQINELENRLAEANEMAMKGGRAAMAKLESRIREMEIELGGVQSKTSESSKAYQKSERRI